MVDVESSRFAWPGSGFELAINGARLNITLDDSGNNSLIIEQDGEPIRLDLRKGMQTYSVYSGSKAAMHRFRITKRTEGFLGATKFISAASDGTFLPVQPPKRSILVIGDSFSAGYGIEGASKDCHFSPDTENQYLTYAALTGRTFGADVIALAESGRGLLKNNDGSRSDTMPEIMLRTIPTEASTGRSAWSGLEPSVVVIHLGTNDFNSGSPPPNFVDAYISLLARVRSSFPKAFIFAALGPLRDSENLKAADLAVGRAVERRMKEGESRLRHLTFSQKSTSSGCDWHPDRAANRDMSETLNAAIRKALGW
jgi:lysophospholipase L1-like esterase